MAAQTFFSHKGCFVEGPLFQSASYDCRAADFMFSFKIGHLFLYFRGGTRRCLLLESAWSERECKEFFLTKPLGALAAGLNARSSLTALWHTHKPSRQSETVSAQSRGIMAASRDKGGFQGSLYLQNGPKFSDLFIAELTLERPKSLPARWKECFCYCRAKTKCLLVVCRSLLSHSRCLRPSTGITSWNWASMCPCSCASLWTSSEKWVHRRKS